jgi:hypothetical protein
LQVYVEQDMEALRFECPKCQAEILNPLMANARPKEAQTAITSRPDSAPSRNIGGTGITTGPNPEPALPDEIPDFIRDPAEPTSVWDGIQDLFALLGGLGVGAFAVLAIKEMGGPPGGEWAGMIFFPVAAFGVVLRHLKSKSTQEVGGYIVLPFVFAGVISAALIILGCLLLIVCSGRF